MTDASWTGYTGSFDKSVADDAASPIGVLNPKLYAAICRVFPEVTVVKSGIPYDGNVVIASGTGHKHIDRMEGGEEYHVNCPQCGDSRSRLYINHRWNTRYEGIFMRYALYCHNEQCHAGPGFIDKLTAMLRCGDVHEADIAKDVVINPDRLRPEVTGKFTPVHELPEEHAAVRYLRDVRGLPIQKLGEVWGVKWASYSLTLPPDNRLFFPIMAEDEEHNLVEVGGQAHWLDAMTLDGTPSKEQRIEGQMKWWTIPGTRTGRNLYNGHIAKQQKDLIIITEGAFDVQRVGERPGTEKYPVGIFGHSVSEHQKQILWDHWGRHDAIAILALDPDVYHSKKEGAEKDLKKVLALEDWFKSKWKHFHALRLDPEGDDIGAMDATEVWSRIDDIIGGFSSGVV